MTMDNVEPLYFPHRDYDSRRRGSSGDGADNQEAARRRVGATANAFRWLAAELVKWVT
jgi:hypothetical protein